MITIHIDKRRSGKTEYLRKIFMKDPMNTLFVVPSYNEEKRISRLTGWDKNIISYNKFQHYHNTHKTILFDDFFDNLELKTALNLQANIYITGTLDNIALTDLELEYFKEHYPEYII